MRVINRRRDDSEMKMLLKGAEERGEEKCPRMLRVAKKDKRKVRMIKRGDDNRKKREQREGRHGRKEG